MKTALTDRAVKAAKESRMKSYFCPEELCTEIMALSEGSTQDVIWWLATRAMGSTTYSQDDVMAVAREVIAEMIEARHEKTLYQATLRKCRAIAKTEGMP
jgi:hypothetical protein